ncbi:MAG: hypothetical protein ACTSPV_17025 [Candidatus Hodarchaeales archaeon]
MKNRRLLMSFFLYSLIIPIFNLSQSSIQANTVEWDSSLKNGTILKWRVVFVGGDPHLGSQSVYFNSTIEIRFSDNPSGLFSDLYNGEIPSWYTIYLDGNIVEQQTLSQIEKEFFYGFIWPLSIHWDNGTTTPLSDFLYIYKPSFGNTSFINSNFENHLGVRWQNDTSFDACNFQVSNTTGIAKQVEKYDANAIVAQIDIDENTTTEEDGESPVKIEWADSVQKGSILAWNVSRFDATPETEFKLGQTSIQEGTVLQMGFIKNPPTNPASYFDLDGSPDWLEIFIDGDEISLSTIGEEGEILFYFALPVNYIFENGSVFHLIDFVSSLNENKDFSNFAVEEDINYINASWEEHWEEEGIQKSDSLNLVWTKSTGIISKFSVESTDGNMTWVYMEEAANLDQSGTTKTINEEYSVELDYPSVIPSFQIMQVLLLLLVAVIARKKRS